MSEKQKKKLKPCKYCGGHAYFTDSKHTCAGVDMIICSECGIRMYNGTIEKWNIEQNTLTADQRAKVIRLCEEVIRNDLPGYKAYELAKQLLEELQG